jgi:hypothetical protein
VTVRRATFLATLDSARSIHSSSPSSFEEVRIGKDSAALACLQPSIAVHYRYSRLSIKSAQLSISRTLSKAPDSSLPEDCDKSLPAPGRILQIFNDHFPRHHNYPITLFDDKTGSSLLDLPAEIRNQFTSMSFRMCLFATHDPITLAWSTPANSCVLSWNPSSLRKRLHGWK